MGVASRVDVPLTLSIKFIQRLKTDISALQKCQLMLTSNVSNASRTLFCDSLTRSLNGTYFRFYCKLTEVYCTFTEHFGRNWYQRRYEVGEVSQFSHKKVPPFLSVTEPPRRVSAKSRVNSGKTESVLCQNQHMEN